MIQKALIITVAIVILIAIGTVASYLALKQGDGTLVKRGEYKTITIKELIDNTAKYDGQKILVKGKYTDMTNRPAPDCIPVGTGQNPEIRERYKTYPSTWGISDQNGEIGVKVIDERGVQISALPNYKENQEIELKGIARPTTVADKCNLDIRYKSVYIEVDVKDIDITLKSYLREKPEETMENYILPAKEPSIPPNCEAGSWSGLFRLCMPKDAPLYDPTFCDRVKYLLELSTGDVMYFMNYEDFKNLHQITGRRIMVIGCRYRPEAKPTISPGDLYYITKIIIKP